MFGARQAEKNLQRVPVQSLVYGRPSPVHMPGGVPLHALFLSSDNATQAPTAIEASRNSRQPMESIVGQTVSHYAFLEKLGSGGMGDIYKARDSRLNRIVAVKVLTPGRTRDPQRRRRFIQEAQAASALNHPNIITIHDILPEGDMQYMVMEHVSGQTLHQLIAAGRLSVPQALQIATQMANALAAAHAAGIIHRDFKPANVMVTSSGLVKILDFGLAKLMDPGARMRSPAEDSAPTADPVTLTAPLTVEGAIMGTVNYMSPEQAEGLKVDARSDIFSFGAVLYEMVTGQRAFDGDSGISTLSAVLRDEVKPIREIAPEVPGELDHLIARCLRKNPAERWQSMSEVAAALTKMRLRPDAAPPPAPAASLTPPPAPVPATTRKSGPKKVLLFAASVAVVAFAIGGTWWQTQRQVLTPPKPPASIAAPVASPVVSNVPPAPQPVPPQTAAPPSNSETPSDAANQIPAAAPPPPPITDIPLGTSAKPLPPPQVATAKPPATKPQAAVGTAPPLPVLPIPRAPAPLQLVTVTLNDGLPFRIALAEDVPVDAEVGQVLHFRVLDGLKSGDVVVIAKGAVVTGSVAALGGKRNFFGERSKVRFRLISAPSVDDSKIMVRATPASKNDLVEARPFATPTESSHDLKDKNLIAASGTEYVAYVSGDQTVNVHQ
jgi:serine/threonine protein kinase